MLPATTQCWRFQPSMTESTTSKCWCTHQKWENAAHSFEATFGHINFKVHTMIQWAWRRVQYKSAGARTKSEDFILNIFSWAYIWCHIEAIYGHKKSTTWYNEHNSPKVRILYCTAHICFHDEAILSHRKTVAQNHERMHNVKVLVHTPKVSIGIWYQPPRIPPTLSFFFCSSVTLYLVNQAWYHRSAGVKTTGKNSESENRN